MKEKKSFLIVFCIWSLTMALCVLFALVMNNYRIKYPRHFCDEIDPERVVENSPTICKLRYPIYNTEEIKNIKKENEELLIKLSVLENKLEKTQNALNEIPEDNSYPDVLEPYF